MQTRMRQEIDEIPQAAARLLQDSDGALRAAGQALRTRDPAVIATIARGSSDHACAFLKYAIELQTGVPVASLGPSLASVYGCRPRLAHAGVITVSQSGGSPDIVAMTRAARAGGGLTVALVNKVPSPVSMEADLVVDIAAGPELAVAATKSFVNAIVAGLSLLAEWGGSAELRRALDGLPEALGKALELDWSSLDETLGNADSLYVLGRGPSFAIAAEAALKCKETCNLHAEAYSAAEVMHGPVALVIPRFPVLAFAACDAAEAMVAETADGLAEKGASVFVTSELASRARRLPAVRTGHMLTDALVSVVPFYRFVEALSRSRGLDPDAPKALKKVTQTR